MQLNQLRSLSICAIFFLFSGVVTAQWQDNTSSIIHYSDGSVFVGQITEETNEGISLKLTTGDTLFLQHALIRKVRYAEEILLYGG